VPRQHISSGTHWEAFAGYSRAVRVGNAVYVSGTTATDAEGRVVGAGDVYAQTVFSIQKIARALETAGAALTDVVRTRIYVVDIARWEDAARAHAEFFDDIRPANTLVEVSALVGPEYLVEVEADAIIASADADGEGAAP
jgi:enamine deaminase RidA (YjgF/YER057c/UK114 family)